MQATRQRPPTPTRATLLAQLENGGAILGALEIEDEAHSWVLDSAELDPARTETVDAKVIIAALPSPQTLRCAAMSHHSELARLVRRAAR